MNRIVAGFAALLAFVLLVSCAPPATPDQSSPWIINPLGDVGGITPRSSREDIIRLFGKDNVQTVEIAVGEGEFEEATRIFPGTDRTVDIEWRGQGDSPHRITIHGDRTEWRTREGLTIGSTLEEVEEANGSPFLLTGLDWDYPARSVSWRDGSLPLEFQLEFAPDLNVSEEDRSKVRGDGQFPSDHDAVRKLRLRVQRIFVLW